jgi:hypothetical protein
LKGIEAAPARARDHFDFDGRRRAPAVYASAKLSSKIVESMPLARTAAAREDVEIRCFWLRDWRRRRGFTPVARCSPPEATAAGFHQFIHVA